MNFLPAISPQSGESSKLGSIDAFLKDLQDRKVALLHELEELEAQIENTKVERARLVNKNALISKLPPELLSYIFLMCQEQSKSFRVVASHVCSDWRSVAIGNALLWNEITFQLRPSMSRLASALDIQHRRFETYLARTGTSIFNLRLDVNGNHDLARTLDALAPHVERCRRLWVVVANHPSACHVLQQSLKSWSAPNLEHLSIHVRYWLHSNDYDRTQFTTISPVIFTGGAPLLTFVRITGTAGSLQPPLANVTTLHLDGAYMDPLMPRQFRDLLSATPSLVNLSLCDINVKELPTGNESTSNYSASVVLPWLRSLRIRVNMNSGFSAVNLLEILPLVNLESVVLSQVEILGSHVFPNVQDLTLYACAFLPEQMVYLKLAFPSVIALTMEYPSSLMLLALMIPEAPAYWPKLKVVSVREIAVAHASLFVDFVRFRQLMEQPLVRVYLDKTGRHNLRRRSMLEQLKALITVDDDDDNEPWPVGLGYEDEDDFF